MNNRVDNVHSYNAEGRCMDKRVSGWITAHLPGARKLDSGVTICPVELDRGDPVYIRYKDALGKAE